MQYLDFKEALFFLAGSGKEQEREIYLHSYVVHFDKYFDYFRSFVFR